MHSVAVAILRRFIDLVACGIYKKKTRNFFCSLYYTIIGHKDTDELTYTRMKNNLNVENLICISHKLND